MARPLFPVRECRTMKDDQRWCTAIHEAAHCIAAHALGATVYGARIGCRRGHATIAGLRGIHATWLRNNDYRRGDARAAAMVKIQVCLAGPIGQSIHDGSAHGCEGDRAMIDDLRRRFDVSDERIRRLERRTERLLLRRWGDVTKLASHLIDARSLSQAAITAILERV